MSVLDTILTNKLLSGIALDVYSILHGSPPITVGEIYKKYRSMRPESMRSRNEIAKRVRDLENWGAIRKCGNDICELTGRRVALFGVTGNLPSRIKAAGSKTKKTPRSDQASKNAEPQAELLGLNNRLKETKAALSAMTDELAEARRKIEAFEQDRALTDLLKAQATLLRESALHGTLHLNTLGLIQDEKVKQIRGFWVTKNKRKRLRTELEAFEYVQAIFEYIRTLK